uniref:Uncharacterized protein n=1 Tax=Romanomermis culicivorax TaxID=13658 RepID=A0A915JXT9_ROMCU
MPFGRNLKARKRRYKKPSKKAKPHNSGITRGERKPQKWWESAASGNTEFDTNLIFLLKL